MRQRNWHGIVHSNPAPPTHYPPTKGAGLTIKVLPRPNLASAWQAWVALNPAAAGENPYVRKPRAPRGSTPVIVPGAGDVVAKAIVERARKVASTPEYNKFGNEH